MTALKALLVKDFHTNKKMLFIPVWIILGLFLLSLIMIGIAVVKDAEGLSLGGIPMDIMQNVDLHRMISFAIQMGLFLGFIAMVFGISIVVSGSMSLNSDVKHKCELFHRSQPLSAWQITGSRYIVGIGGMLGLALLVGLLQYFIINVLLQIFTPLNVNWWMSLNGILLGWAQLSIALLVLGSICFFLSSVFKDNAIGKSALIMGGLELAVQISNYFLGLAIPSPFGVLKDLIFSHLEDFTKQFPDMQYGIQIGKAVNTGKELESFLIPPHFLSTLWSSLFTWTIALKLTISGLLYTLSTFIYKRREVQF